MLNSLLLNLGDFTETFPAELFIFAGGILVVEYFISGPFFFQASVGLNIVLVQLSQLENKQKQLWLSQYTIDNTTTKRK